MVMLSEAHVRARQGIVGDRFFQEDTDAAQKKERVITLIEQEALEAARRDYPVNFGAAECRRNLVVRGVALNHLVGRRFKVGALVLEGKELCEPCDHLAKLTSPTFKQALVHRGGLRAWVREGGVVRAGDVVITEGV
jgi:MOSC domain-containing protein YiiM